VLAERSAIDLVYVLNPLVNKYLPLLKISDVVDRRVGKDVDLVAICALQR
jgi:hypothetical protein